jgi:hypothetical protein
LTLKLYLILSLLPSDENPVFRVIDEFLERLDWIRFHFDNALIRTANDLKKRRGKLSRFIRVENGETKVNDWDVGGACRGHRTPRDSYAYAGLSIDDIRGVNPRGEGRTFELCIIHEHCYPLLGGWNVFSRDKTECRAHTFFAANIKAQKSDGRELLPSKLIIRECDIPVVFNFLFANVTTDKRSHLGVIRAKRLV